MIILVLNCGSSSLKYKLIDMTSKDELASGGVEKIGLEGAFLKFADKEGKKVVLNHDMPDHKEAINFVLGVITGDEYG